MSSHSSSGNRPRSQLQRRHPAHLRGKAIGLWHSRSQKQRRKEIEENDDKPIGKIRVSSETREIISDLLSARFTSKDPEKQFEHQKFKREFLAIANGNIEDKIRTNTITTLSKLPSADEELLQEMQHKFTHCKQYQQFSAIRQKLPCYGKMGEILNTIKKNQVTLISGETGCGKTTQIPQYILEKNILKGDGSITRIICTQPRRISAISVAERVAEERGEVVGGNSVGYQIRLEKQLPRHYGSITYCTTGVLLKQMECDPCLSEVSHIILDEIHERDTLCDFLITLLKLLISRRKDLKVILMSATFNAETFAKYFNNECGKVTVPGFTFPVTEYYLEDILKITRHEFMTFNKRYRCFTKREVYEEFLNFTEPYIRQIERNKTYPGYVIRELRNPNSEELDIDLVKKLLIEICKQEPGAVLVFLPGYGDISKLYNILKESSSFPSYKYLIIPLHSKMPSVQQRKIFDEPPAGMRKIIISTNIAETSITINDVVYVVDCGKIKIKNYNAEKNIDSLEPEWVSLANADQRRGRAGRVKPGVCYHLFTRARKMILEKQQKPEILRERLESVILQIKMLQLGRADSFLGTVMDPPPREAIEVARNTLRNMNALDSNEKLTPLGYHLAKLPMSPQMGKMILLASLFSCLDPILSVAASLDFRDPFQLPLGKENEALQKRKELCEFWNSDHLILHEALIQYLDAKAQGHGREFCRDFFLNSNTLDLLHDMKKQLAEYLHEMHFISDSNFKNMRWNINSHNKSLVKAIIAAGLYPNIAVVKKVNPHRKLIITANREKVSIVKSSINDSALYFASPLLIYFLKMESMNKIWLHDTTMIYPLPLFFFGDEIIVKNEGEKTTIELPTSLPIKYQCTKEVADMIIDLRTKFEGILEYKVGHPGIIDWTDKCLEVSVLEAILELISSENSSALEYENY